MGSRSFLQEKTWEGKKEEAPIPYDGEGFAKPSRREKSWKKMESQRWKGLWDPWRQRFRYYLNRRRSCEASIKKEREVIGGRENVYLQKPSIKAPYAKAASDLGTRYERLNGKKASSSKGYQTLFFFHDA